MQAAIDVGSNTVRMLIGECRDNMLYPEKYYRSISRLAGGFSPQNELADESMERTLDVLNRYSKILQSSGVADVRVVGTAALRRAVNRQLFVDRVQTETGLVIEIIDGAEEARLMARGVLSVVQPVPAAAVIFDIGGGSTEFVCVQQGMIKFQQSYALGVVQLSEGFSTVQQRNNYVAQVVSRFVAMLAGHDLLAQPYQLIGTAGTLTTLAAMHLQLAEYDARLINNHVIPAGYLRTLQLKLQAMSEFERENLIGMEKGRGDLILPGLDIVLQLLERFELKELKIADSGLLEGVLLESCPAN